MFLDKPHAGAIQDRLASQSTKRGIDAADILAALWRRTLFLLICGLLGAGFAVTLSKFVPHRYVATAELLVDPRDLRLLDKEVMPRAGESDSGITVVESQVQVLSSNSVLKRAISALDLQNDPEFNGTQGNVLTTALPGLAGYLSSEPKGDRETTALQTLQQRIGVKRPERTFVIELSVISNDPTKSARIADAIIAAYLEDQAQYRSSSNEGAAEALDSGLKAMKEQVNAAEEKIAAYKAANNLGLASGKLVVEQQLTDANNQLALARAATERIKAQMDDIQASRATPESIPEIMASQTLINLKKQLATVTAERARFAAQLMPKHPVMVTMAQQERAVRSEMDREILRVLGSIRHDYERAKANEQSLADAVQRLKGEMNEAAKAQIELRELERNLEVTQSLYQQSVARSRETREQSRLNTTNVRIISAAMPLPARVFPPRGVILAILGFLVGQAFAAAAILLPLVRGLFETPRSVGATGASSDRAMPSARERDKATEIPLKTPQNGKTTAEAGVDTSADETPRGAARAPTLVKASNGVSSEDDVVPLSPRRLICDMRAASRAAQTVWLRDGTSAMASLARVAATSPDTAFADHIRTLHGYLGGRASSDAVRTVWFVSNHGVPIKPVIALAFAHACVAEGKKVLLVDGDVRTPGLTRLLVADGSLSASTAREVRGKISKTRDPNLDLLIVNNPDASSILASLDDAKRSYDVVIIDARTDALSRDLDATNQVLFVSSNRPNDTVAFDTGVDALTKDMPRLCGTILTAKGLARPTAAVAVHAI
ncbi:exopolysaccharide transport family protein [Hyphomicrobium sp.]|uniref:exopolysaccharide transport family protein n=1 Tax=Hyphomicrobium sp. TaxID=82 RepID=UPI001D479B8F|nr:exopolysaccharide transport family protein [Hyphomicrobium sp.]MBY0561832.1 exopolysaccharide transport family protein [Hyphomicrobium sp.]